MERKDVEAPPVEKAEADAVRPDGALDDSDLEGVAGGRGERENVTSSQVKDHDDTKSKVTGSVG